MHYSTLVVILAAASTSVFAAPAPLEARRHHVCPSGKRFDNTKVGCTPCKVVGNKVCGRDEDKIADLICTASKFGNTWIPILNSGACGVITPPETPEVEKDVKKCPSGKIFDNTKVGCNKCQVVGNKVCGRDEDRIADLICTASEFGNTWIPINNPGACGVFAAPPTPPPVKQEAAKTCPSGKAFDNTKVGCNKCQVVGNKVCGRDEDRIADLICTDSEFGNTWIPINNPGACGV